MKIDKQLPGHSLGVFFYQGIVADEKGYLVRGTKCSSSHVVNPEASALDIEIIEQIIQSVNNAYSDGMCVCKKDRGQHDQRGGARSLIYPYGRAAQEVTFPSEVYARVGLSALAIRRTCYVGLRQCCDPSRM